MPRTLSGLRAFALGLGTVAATLASTGTAAAAPRAHALLNLACPTATATPFAPWGDGASYALAPDGGLENSSTGWTLAGGAAVVPGNEAFAVSGPGRSSLSLPAGSSATSAPMCVALGSGKMRFFTANAGAAGSRLHVQIVYRGGLGGILGIVDAGTVSSGKAWQPSSSVGMLGGLVPLLTQSVQFRFTPLDTTGSWRIDDIYLDPLMHR